MITDRDDAGDQVMEWDGSSLQDATFEEARDIMSRSGDTVQVVLMHCRYDTPARTPVHCTPAVIDFDLGSSRVYHALFHC